MRKGREQRERPSQGVQLAPGPDLRVSLLSHRRFLTYFACWCLSPQIRPYFLLYEWVRLRVVCYISISNSKASDSSIFLREISHGSDTIGLPKIGRPGLSYYAICANCFRKGATGVGSTEGRGVLRFAQATICLNVSRALHRPRRTV